MLLDADALNDDLQARAEAMGVRGAWTPLELTMLRVGVLRGELGFDDLRVWFANCLRPLGA